MPIPTTSVSGKLFDAVPIWTGTIGSGGVADGSVGTIPLASATGLTNGNAYIFTIDRVDANQNKTPSKKEVVIGELSGSNFINCNRGVEGTAQAHSAGAVVEILFTATHWDKLLSMLDQDHVDLGYHKSLTDANGNEWIKQTATSSAVNEITVSNAATGNSPLIEATGDDTNVSLVFKAKGSGKVKIADATTPTKTLAFDTAGATASKTMTIASSHTDDRTITLPDATDTLVGRETTDTLTNKTISTGSALDANASENFTYYSLARQAIINGNFDVWQRGTSFTNPANTTYTADRWRNAISLDGGTPPSNIIISRQILTSGDIANSFYYLRVSSDGAGSGYGSNAFYTMLTRIEHGVRFLSGLDKKITLSFWARSSITNKKLGYKIDLNYGTGGSPSSTESISPTSTITLTSSWQKFTYTFNLNTLSGKTFGTDNNDYMQLSFAYMWGSTRATTYGDSIAESWASGTIDIAQVQLCAGDVALPFQPKSFEDELRACQRYYEKSYDYTTVPGTATTLNAVGMIARSTTIAHGVCYFKVTKRITPTVVLYDGAGTAGNSENIGIASVPTTATNLGMSGFGSMTTSSTWTVGNYIRAQWTADAEL